MNIKDINPETEISIVLFEPRIPQNTGCIARTCAALDIPLILIEPLGFSLGDKYLKRAGLDYWPFVQLKIYPTFDSYQSTLTRDQRIIGCSKSNGSNYRTFKYKSGDQLLFGREDNGLPSNIRNECNKVVSIPMRGASQEDGTGGVRSLNLSVAMGIISYQASSTIGIL